MNNIISAAAHQVALAESAANAAADDLAAGHSAADNIRTRRDALVAERDAIAVTRKAGNDIDPGRLAVLGLDLAAVEELIADATAAVAAAQTKADETRAAVAAARQQLDLVKDRELLARLAPHATALSAKLAGTMAEIRAVEARLKLPRPSWAPAKAFANEVRKLDLQGDGVPGIRQ
jgi:chromosome segregation ATPase